MSSPAANPLDVHLRLLEKKPLRLKGKADPKLLDLGFDDELVHLNRPLEFDVEAEMVGADLLVRGSIYLPIDCECSRCLKPYVYELELDPWVCHIPLEAEGEKVVLNGDAVDLTPYLREEIVLALPQHPLCENECNGLPGLVKSGEDERSVAQSSGKKPASIWDQLDKLKLR
ncbi:MAG: DUF177 domain-containing protein [Verrucomicrobiales bacterium]|nr:DUF177 domain-containing protein [Verrucomicrobiales bacterium]